MNKKTLSVSIVVADYYKEITDSLTNAAVEHLQNNNTNYEIFKVPGVYEIPQFINWKLSKKKINTVVIEKNHSFGEETSSRNSGVIHAGIYYPKSSKRSAFCKQGNKLLYKYLKERKSMVVLKRKIYGWKNLERKKRK